MRGERENKCLNMVKDFLYKNNISFYCHNKSEIIKLISSVNKNPVDSEFPDFISKYCLIEHFQVTGSKETRKGAKHSINQNTFIKQVKTQTNIFYENINKTIASNKLVLQKSQATYNHYTYQNFEKSFKKNYEKHLKSLEKYNGKKDKVIFLIEYNGAPLTCVLNQKVIGFYKLSEDVNLLKYIYDFRDSIHYIIFIDGQHCQIIETELIDDLLKKIPQKIAFGSGRYIDSYVNIFFDCVDGSKEFLMEKISDE